MDESARASFCIKTKTADRSSAKSSIKYPGICSANYFLTNYLKNWLNNNKQQQIILVKLKQKLKNLQIISTCATIISINYSY